MKIVILDGYTENPGDLSWNGFEALGEVTVYDRTPFADGSGEIVIAFTTANRVPHYSEKALLPMTLLHDDAINPLFRAVAECVEESVLSSLLHAETVTGNHGQTFHSLTELLKNRA